MNTRSQSSGRAAVPGGEHLETTCDYAAEAQATELVKILDEYLAGMKAGQKPSKAELIAKHPDLASQLEACLAGLEFIYAAESASRAHPQTLGDYRILREVGRGGMGAVFEAEQISLGRRVALKILRFGGVSDPEAVERFQREAETVAKLHHTNIVPIFAVGSERGVNFYAMQFIDGRSLAEVLAEKKQPLSSDRVADWGLQAAEALAHAHQRGVIHRDVKPSNLLLDNEQRLWLTDFGLARRMDDVTLSMTGALLGTPRYMSPEQAVASKKRVDHRSDLFSLGATLYELLTGQPAFAGETPHDVIQQILTGEPTPIRQLNSSVPRDLETIVMKCLGKEPGQRYGAARDLADDLRAFLDGRPIRARRASLVELASRWFKAQQRSVKLMATAAAVTLAVTLLGIFGLSGYDAWRQGLLKLNTPTPPLVAEVMDEQGNVLKRETLPMQESASLPAGEYLVRAASEGAMSQTYAVEIHRANDVSHSLDLRDERLLSMDVSRSFAFSDLGKSRKSIVLLGNDGISPFGSTPAQAGPKAPALKDSPGFRWPWSDGSEQHSGFGIYDLRPWVAPRGSDLNGDGQQDLICAGRHQAWLMAISGQDGSILWFAGRGHDVQSPPEPNRPYYLRDAVSSAVIGEAIIDGDCDGDGINDVIATLADVGPEMARLSGEQIVARCWVEAISGRSGQSLWSYELSPKWFELPAGVEVPYQYRWFAGSSSGSSSRGRTMMRTGRHVTREPSQMERSGTHAYRPEAARRVRLGDQQPLAVMAGSHIVLLDASSGKESQPPMDCKVHPGRSPQWADMDGDGAVDLAAISLRPPRAMSDLPRVRLDVWSVALGKSLWSRDLDADWPVTQSWTVNPSRLLLVEDLNGDGKCELACPDGSSRAGNGLGSDSGTPWGRLEVFDGAGKELWNRRLVSMDRQIDQLVAGPDLDGDGWREVYAATMSGSQYRICVDALSGKSGQTLWRASHPSPFGGESLHLAPPRWWGSGADGWPQLMVEAASDEQGRSMSLVCAFSAGTGQVTRVGRGITSVEPSDIDGDGIEDLVVFDAPSGRLDFGGKLHVLRGVSAEPWRQIGSAGDPAADFDGDGVVDLVHSWADGTLLADSGRTSQLLWRSKIGPASRAVQSRRAGSDLDGDGTEDLLAWAETFGPRSQSYPFHALSGKSGKLLWNARQIDSQIVNGVFAAQCADLDHDGRPEVIWMVASDHGYPAGRQSWSSQDVQLWLFVVSGQTGALRWKQPLSRAYGQTPGGSSQILMQGIWFALSVGDADGDGVDELFVPAIREDAQSGSEALETRVFSGTNGNLLWHRPATMDSNRQASLEQWIPPAICDLEGDGSVEVVFAEMTAKEQTFQVAAVNGRDGRQRWSWNSQVRGGYWNTYPGQSRGDLMRPVVFRAGGNRRRIGVFLPNYEGKAAMLESDGSANERKIGSHSYVSGMLACDVNHDGIDEAVFLDKSSLIVAPSDKLDVPLWTRETGSAAQGRILGFARGSASAGLRNGAEPPPVIALVADPTDNSVLGLDSASGAVMWVCPGPIPRSDDLTYLMMNQLSLLGAGPHDMPFVYYAYASVARCRQAAATVPTLAGNAAFAKRGVTAATPSIKVAGHDLRWLRSLPWVEEHISWRRGATFVGWGLYFSTMLIVVPTAYLGRLVWLRRFSLWMLLLLPVIAGLFLTAALVRAPIDNDFATIVGRLSIGLALSPAVVGLGLLGWWTLRGQWRRVALWLTMTLLISVACAAVATWQKQQWSPLLPEESYDFGGWYLIWLPGAYITAWIAMVLLPTKYAVAAAWKWWRGPSIAPRAAGHGDPTIAMTPSKPVIPETGR